MHGFGMKIPGESVCFSLKGAGHNILISVDSSVKNPWFFFQSLNNHSKDILRSFFLNINNVPINKGWAAQNYVQICTNFPLEEQERPSVWKFRNSSHEKKRVLTVYYRNEVKAINGMIFACFVTEVYVPSYLRSCHIKHEEKIGK